MQIPEAGSRGVVWKKMFFKILQNSQETPVPEGNTYEFCKMFKNTFLTEQLRTTASVHCKIEAREMDCLRYREVDAMLFTSAKL